MTAIPITSQGPEQFNGRAAFTAWLEESTHDDVEFAWIGDVDLNGGRWVGLRSPEFPLHSVGFYFENNGTCSGFRFEPMRLTDTVGAPLAVSGQLTARLIRQVPFGRLEPIARSFAEETAREEHAEAQLEISFSQDGRVVGSAPLVEGGGTGSELEVARADRLAGISSTKPADRRGGRKPIHDDRFFAEQARRYVNALGDRPVQQVARETYYRESQVRNHIAEARKRGLLTPTPPGRAGGQLTPKALAILEGIES